MTVVNLESLWLYYQSHKPVCCLHSLARLVHNFRKIQVYTYLATLVATFIS